MFYNLVEVCSSSNRRSSSSKDIGEGEVGPEGNDGNTVTGLPGNAGPGTNWSAAGATAHSDCNHADEKEDCRATEVAEQQEKKSTHGCRRPWSKQKQKAAQQRKHKAAKQRKPNAAK